MKSIAEIIDEQTIHIYDLSQFDLDAIMHSGQVFRYSKKGSGYRLVAGQNYAEISIEGDKAIIRSNDSAYFFRYFDLCTDYNEIKQQLLIYGKFRQVITAGGGIRILRAEFAETVISFILSANNNIKRFTKTLNSLAGQYGDRLPDGQFAFPTLGQLSHVTEHDFDTLGCGYRSRYLVKAIRQLNDIDCNMLKQLQNDELRRELLKIYGVGPKVCACVMLFCGDFHRLDTAPVDTWISKALEQLTEAEKDVLLKHKYAGVAQQYIFYYLQYLHKDLSR